MTRHVPSPCIDTQIRRPDRPICTADRIVVMLVVVSVLLIAEGFSACSHRGSRPPSPRPRRAGQADLKRSRFRDILVVVQTFALRCGNIGPLVYHGL